MLKAQQTCCNPLCDLRLYQNPKESGNKTMIAHVNSFAANLNWPERILSNSKSCIRELVSRGKYVRFIFSHIGPTTFIWLPFFQRTSTYYDQVSLLEWLKLQLTVPLKLRNWDRGSQESKHDFMIASRSNLKLRKDFEEWICSYSVCPFKPYVSLAASGERIRNSSLNETHPQ